EGGAHFLVEESVELFAVRGDDFDVEGGHASEDGLGPVLPDNGRESQTGGLAPGLELSRRVDGQDDPPGSARCAQPAAVELDGREPGQDVFEGAAGGVGGPPAGGPRGGKGGGGEGPPGGEGPGPAPGAGARGAGG